VKQVLPTLGPSVQYVSVDVVPSESADLLKRYADRNGFNWAFAAASAEMNQALTARFGEGFLTTTSVPMFVIDSKGQVHLTHEGHKSPDELRQFATQYASSSA